MELSDRRLSVKILERNFHILCKRGGRGGWGKNAPPFFLPLLARVRRLPSIHRTSEFLSERSLNRETHVIRKFPQKRLEI